MTGTTDLDEQTPKDFMFQEIMDMQSRLQFEDVVIALLVILNIDFQEIELFQTGQILITLCQSDAHRITKTLNVFFLLVLLTMP